MSQFQKYITEQKPERHYISEDEFYVELEFPDDLQAAITLGLMTAYAGMKGYATEDGFIVKGSKSKSEEIGVRKIKVSFYRSPKQIQSKEIQSKEIFLTE